MPILRRALAVPLFVVGGLLLAIGYGGGLAAFVYFEVRSVLLLVHGHVGEALLIGGVVAGVAAGVLNLVGIPGLALIAGANHLRAGTTDDDAYAPRQENPRWTDEDDHDEDVHDVDLYPPYSGPLEEPHSCPHCARHTSTANGLDQHVAAKHPGA